MTVVGRNSPCACGSGKKYKRCCEAKEAEFKKSTIPSGHFRYKSGSYGGAGTYMPSILCLKEIGSDSWVEHFCLVKPDATFNNEDAASQTAERHLLEAHALKDAANNIEAFALFLRQQGYKNVNDFKIIKKQKA